MLESWLPPGNFLVASCWKSLHSTLLLLRFFGLKLTALTASEIRSNQCTQCLSDCSAEDSTLPLAKREDPIAWNVAADHALLTHRGVHGAAAVN
jgi:hypothetical protein